MEIQVFKAIHIKFVPYSHFFYKLQCKGGDPGELMTQLAFKAYILPRTNGFHFAREF